MADDGTAITQEGLRGQSFFDCVASVFQRDRIVIVAQHDLIAWK